MARYVIVEFDDNAQADEFVRRVNSNPERPFRVPWMFAKPTKICECPSARGNMTRTAEPHRSARGERFGWWVCRDCHRASPLGYQTPHNLLDMEQLEVPLHLRRLPGWSFKTVNEDRSYLPGRGGK